MKSTVLSTSGGKVSSAVQLVAEYGKVEVASHPLFAMLRSKPTDLQAIWILMANLRAGISRDFVLWLTATISRVEDRRIGSLAAKQLNDELGNGDFNAIHSVLLDRFVEGLEPWRWRGIDEAQLLAPGRRLGSEAGSIFTHSEDSYEAVGALMVGEVFAEKMDRCVGDEIRRQTALSAETLHWLTLHETLEVDHAGDSSVLAELIPPAKVVAVQRGAEAMWSALWTFLDGVHAVVLSRRAQS